MFRFRPKRTGKTPRLLADRARDARNWQLAARYYREAVKGDPGEPAIWVQYGHALKESGNVLEAERAYRKSIELDGSVADTHLQLGHALKLQNRRNESANSYFRAIALDPTLVDAALELVSLGWTTASINDRTLGTIPWPQREDRVGSSNAQPERSVPGRSIVFDVSDMLNYFLENRLPQGIQRVQISVVSNLLRRQERAVDLAIAYFAPESGFWLPVSDTLFLELARLAVASGERDDPAWHAVLNELKLIRVAARPLEFSRGATLVNIGSSWYLDNYCLMLRFAKSKYGINFIPLIHDCIPIVTPGHCSEDHTQVFTGWLIEMLYHADKFLVNSNATRTDLVEIARRVGRMIPEPAVIRLDGRLSADGAENGRSRRRNRNSVLKRHGRGREPFVLFVATIESRKNHLLAFTVWLSMIRKRGLRRTPLLVCVGKVGWLVGPTMALLNESALLQQRVLILSDIADDDLAELYRGCLFTLFPSLYEGWGLPVTEALCHGKVPLITAVSSLPEAGGDLAEYFDHHSERDLTEKLERLIDDTRYRAAREARIQESFKPRAWGDIADEIIREVLSSSTTQHVSPAAGTDEIWPLPAEAGRYYVISRNVETDLWPGMAPGEMYRMGRGWWSPDDWGSWLKRDQADIAFSLAEAGKSPYLIHLRLNGTPLNSADYHVRIVGGIAVESGTLEPGSNRWVTLRTEPAAGQDAVIHLQLTSTGRCDLADVTDGRDRRVVTLGVFGFYVCREDDLLARQRLIEAVQADRLDRLNGPEVDISAGGRFERRTDGLVLTTGKRPV